jgi:hypothetical protein
MAPPVARNVAVIGGTVTAIDAALGSPAAPMLPGLDNPGIGTTYGIPHDTIRYIVSGIFDGPSYITQTSDAGKNGVFALDAGGQPVKKGLQPISFTLVIPRSVTLDPAHPLPLVVYQAGLGQDRHRAFAIAEALAEQGVGMLSVDLLFHGSRALGAVDLVNNTTLGASPDGIGDDRGMAPLLQYFGVSPQGTRALDPLAMRDAMRQSVVDLVATARFVKAGDLSAIGAAEPNLAGLTLRADRVVGMAEGLGMPLLLLAAWAGHDYTAVAGSQPSGGIIFPYITTTPLLAAQILPKVGELFGITAELGSAPERHPMLTLYQQVLEPADWLALAPAQPAQHTLIVQAFSDEVASNQSEELMEYVSGLPALGAGQYRYQQLENGALPATGNVNITGQMLTAGVVQFGMAGGELFERQSQTQVYMPGFPPFSPWPSPGMTLRNPIVAVQTQLVTFVVSHFTSTSGTPTIAAP